MTKRQLREIIEEVLTETIRKVDGKYVVYPKNGGDRLGTHVTYKDALAQLRAIEASKHMQEGPHDPMNPGILKKRLGKLSCSKVRAERAKLKDKGTTYAKALQRYLNYHCQ